MQSRDPRTTRSELIRDFCLPWSGRYDFASWSGNLMKEPSALGHGSLVQRLFSMQSTRRVFRLKIYISLTNWIATLCMRLVISDNRYGGHAKWVLQYFKHFKCLWAFFPGLKSFKSSLTGISGKCFIMESRNKGTAGVFMHEAHWWSCR